MPVMHDHRVENEQRIKQKLPMLYCPFGCTGRDVNPNSNGSAECCHLVGHTIDEKERVFEPLGDAPWNPEFFSTSRLKRQKVLTTDIVINPLVKQLLRTGIHWAKKWVSARVYRACTESQAADWRKRHAHPTDYELEASLAEDDKDLLIDKLERELAALKGQPLEEGPDESPAQNAVAFGPPEPGELDDAQLELLTAPGR
jgi:hypothetical protein